MTQWSDKQEDIYEHVAHSPNHLVVIARAGSGKTTTCVEMTRRVPRRLQVMMCAFNVKNKEDLARRVGPGVDVLTFNAMGFRGLKSMWGGDLDIDKRRQWRLIDKILPDKKFIGVNASADVRKMVMMAMAKLSKTDQEIDDLIDEFGLNPSIPGRREQYVKWTQAILAETREQTYEVSFDDQIYIPAYFGARCGQYDVVFVDEAQDINPAQRALVLGTVKKGGKIIAVGDDRQAIYGWRGAGVDALHEFIADLNADVLPLSITYRCPVAVVELVNNIVPDLEAAPNAIEGVVAEKSEKEFLAGVQPGDIVISRTNAAIAKYSMKLLLQGKRCQILGRDLSEGLMDLIDKPGKSRIKDLLPALDEYVEKEVERLEAARKEDKAEELIDRAAAIRDLSEGLESTYELHSRLSQLFGDIAALGSIVFSTVHKAKGLEFPRVWMLETTFNTKSVEGENLYYVAATRAMAELFLVQIPKKDGKLAPSQQYEWSRKNGEEDE